MYFWKINTLNEQLIKGSLEEAESFKYLMANSILFALATIQYEMPSQYDNWTVISTLIITILGVLLAYKVNGGKKGKNIMQRYMSVSFVVFIRLFVLLILPATLILTLIQEFYFGMEYAQLVFFIETIIYTVIFSLVIAKHIRHIAIQSKQVLD